MSQSALRPWRKGSWLANWSSSSSVRTAQGKKNNVRTCWSHSARLMLCWQLIPAEHQCPGAPGPSSGLGLSWQTWDQWTELHRHSGMAAVGCSQCLGQMECSPTALMAVSAGEAERGAWGWVCVASGEGAVAVSHATEAAPPPQQGQCCSTGCC